MAVEVSAFTLERVLGWSADLRCAARASGCFERAAASISQYLREQVVGPDGARVFSVVRTFRTHPVYQVPANRRGGLNPICDADHTPRCLIELGAFEPPYVEFVPSNGAAPSLRDLLSRWRIALPDEAGAPFAVFDVPALGQAALPRGLFTDDAAIGFAGELEDGERLLAIAALRESLPRELAELFETVALNAFRALDTTAFDSVFAA